MTSSSSTTIIENKIFFSKYKPERKIGEGSFGKIYLANNIQTGEQCAVKFENKNTNQSLLEQEAYLLCYLKGEGIPQIKSYGYSGEYNVMVMELLGKSLEKLFQECNKRFTIKTVCMLAIQMITRLQYIHSKHILHRDIKPDNFTMGTGNNGDKVYIIDFGLSKKYRSSKTLQHIKYNEYRKMAGTARYASIRAIKGCEQGRRDDMESVGYVLMYFLRGSLPWQGLHIGRKEDRYLKIYEKKRDTTAEELCYGYPKQFKEYVEYTRAMEFEQEPNYEYLKGLFYQVLKENNWSFDYKYDWKEDTMCGGVKSTVEYSLNKRMGCDNNNNNKKDIKDVKKSNDNVVIEIDGKMLTDCKVKESNKQQQYHLQTSHLLKAINVMGNHSCNNKLKQEHITRGREMYYSKYKFLSDVINDPINNQYTQVISQQQCQHIHNINDDYDDDDNDDNEEIINNYDDDESSFHNSKYNKHKRKNETEPAIHPNTTGCTLF
jgi:serine/threonine protein kinase